jgi:stage 0 sporulation protein B (sporulation initiation phosphotransferase)
MKKKEWNTVEVLRHARHDWLNQIQLIKGNLDLNKLDRVREIIDEIVMEAQNESKLSNLNSHQFATLLLTSKWENYSFEFEFQVIDELKCGSIDDLELVTFTRQLFECLNESIRRFGENHLILTIELIQKGSRFFFDFSGIIERKDLIEQFLQSLNVGITVERFYISETEMVLDVFSPYRSNS